MNALRRSLLSDIRPILANPTQENRSMERHTPLPAHCKFYSVLGVFHHRHNPGPVFDHRESSTTSRQLLFRCHDSQYERRSADFRIPRLTCWTTIHWYLPILGWSSQIIHYIPPSTSFHNWYWWVCFIYNYFLIKCFFFSFLNEALPMLDHVAPTIGYGYPVYFIVCVSRC